MMDKKRYIDTVRKALDDESARRLSREAYRDALEEIECTVQGMLAAVTDEIEREEHERGD